MASVTDRGGCSLSTAVEKLTARGYTGDFRAEAGGLREVRSGRTYAPEALVVDELMRFEGLTDPDDQSIVLALRSESDGTRGTFTVGYGPGADPIDGEMLRRLPDSRR